MVDRRLPVAHSRVLSLSGCDAVLTAENDRREGGGDQGKLLCRR
jgi:hypothetical protein